MMSEKSPDAAMRALGHFWDGLVHGRTAASGELDPGFVAAITELHARDAAPNADPAFAARLGGELMEAWSAARHELPELLQLPVSPNGLAPSSPLPPSAQQPVRKAIDDPMGVLTAAALVLLMLGATIVAFGIASRGSVDQHSRPSAISGPIPAFSDPQTDLGLLTTASTNELPLIAGYVAIERWTYPPGSDPVTTPALSGPMLFFVTSGEVTVALDGQAIPPPGSMPDDGQDGIDALFAVSSGRVVAGQRLLLPANTRMTTSNARMTEATALVIPINAEREEDWTLPYDQTSVRQELLARTRSTFSPGSATIGLRRAVIAPEERVPPPPAGTFQLVGSESKFLGYLGRRPDGSVINLEKDPLVVLIVTISQEEN